MTSKVWNRLSNHGPATLEGLNQQGGLSYEIRRDGVRKFNPRSRYDGGTLSSAGRNIPVYYIEGKHSPKTIIERWIEANPKIVDAIPDWSLHHRITSHGEEFKQASRELLGPFDRGGGGDHELKNPTCPLCGDDYNGRNLPDHLSECEKA